jgi:general secretion pathway protein G
MVRCFDLRNRLRFKLPFAAQLANTSVIAMIHVNRGATSLGIFSEEEVRNGLRNGRFAPTDIGWREGMGNWQSLSEFSEFAASGVAQPRAGPPLTSSPATAATDVAKTEPLAIWSLVLTIVSLFSCGLILGIPGVICGHLALSKIRKNTTLEGRRLAVAALVIGYISITLWLILITPILGGVAISKLGNTTAIAKSMRVQADVQAIKTQPQLYESMNGFFPTTEQGLQALVAQPQNDPRPTRWYQLFKELPKDPWGNDYIYRDPGLKNPGGYDLYSAGPDRQADTSDDDWGGG